MNVFGHLAFGLLVAAIFSFGVKGTFLSFDFLSVTALALISLAALLPDIDLGISRVSRVVFFVAIVFFSVFFKQYTNRIVSGFLQEWIAAIILAVLVVVVYVVIKPKHRTVTHTFAFGLVFAMFAYIVSNNNIGIATASLLSFSTHLLGDLKI